MRQLALIRRGELRWQEVPEPRLEAPGDALVRPIAVGRCDGDCLPIHRRVSRAMQAGLRLGVIDGAVGRICGPVPFAGPLAIGHECVAEVVEVGAGVSRRRVGELVVVPWSVSCGECANCRRGLTTKCLTTRATEAGLAELAAYGFGPVCGPWGGFAADLVRVPYADHLLVPVPGGVPAQRVAAASDNLADAWRCIVPHLDAYPQARVLVLGGGAQSIGLYAAGLAVARGAPEVAFLDTDPDRLRIAEALGARVVDRPIPRRARRVDEQYDIVVEASSSSAGLRHAIRSTAPGGHCTAVGYYVGTVTPAPIMAMYATGMSLHVGVTHPRPILPGLLDWVDRSGFAAETVTTELADFDDAPRAYAARTTKLVLTRDRVTAPRADDVCDERSAHMERPA